MAEQKTSAEMARRRRCPKGSHRSRKTGKCSRK